MTKVALSIVVCALTCLFVMASYPSRSGAVSRAPGFETADQSLLVEIKKHNKKKNNKKKNDDDAGLTTCAIQEPGSGGGCKTGLKWACTKLKNGKQCCSCITDKNAKPANQPQPGRFTCTDGESSVGSDARNESEARATFDAYLKAHQLTPKGSVTCRPG